MANVFRVVSATGGSIDFLNDSTALAAGATVKRNGIVGVVSRAVAASEYGSMHVQPSIILEGPVNAAGGENFAIGDVVYFNTSTGYCTKTDPTSNGYKLGHAVAGAGGKIGGLTSSSGACAAGETVVRVRLETVV